MQTLLLLIFYSISHKTEWEIVLYYHPYIGKHLQELHIFYILAKKLMHNS